MRTFAKSWRRQSCVVQFAHNAPSHLSRAAAGRGALQLVRNDKKAPTRPGLEI
jgi:hypothetical protein